MVSLNKDIHTQYIQGLKSGSYSDFNKLYSIYSDLLYGFVLHLTKSPSDAKDVLQETYLRISACTLCNDVQPTANGS